MVDQIRVVFCADPFTPGRVDPLYESERAAAEQAGIRFDLLGYEALVDDGDAERAIRSVEASDASTLAVYRGWMLRPERYRALHAALDARGVPLVNDPDAYAHCHHLPNWYQSLQAWTPRSTWFKTDGEVSTGQIAAALREFDGRPVVVKDFVKSQKHHWADACFIPSSADTATAERVVRRFLSFRDRT